MSHVHTDILNIKGIFDHLSKGLSQLGVLSMVGGLDGTLSTYY